MTTFYFGAMKETGHYWWGGDGFKLLPMHSTPLGGCPWLKSVDGKLAPRMPGQFGSEFPQGIADLHRAGGWTALAFWDRTVDKRPGSNSTFVTPDYVNFDEMLLLAKAAFPRRWSAMAFPVTLRSVIDEVPT